MESQLNDLIEKIRDHIDSAEKKIKKYKRGGRFNNAHQYWTGVRKAYLHILSLLER